MNAIAKQENRAVVASADAAALIQVITQAAKDPSVDINKLERLMAMHDKVVARDAERAFNEAMNACQAELQQIAPDANNPQTRSKYATYGKLDSVLRPIYTRNGFSLSFDEHDAPNKPETVRVVCYVSHVGGHTRTYHRDMPADGKGAKGGDVMTKTHAAGAAGSYGARYLLKGIFNVAIGEYDNDGNGAEAGGMDENKLADYLAAIDATTCMDDLQKAFGGAWKAATEAKDKGAQRLLTEHKDRRKRALGGKS